MSVSLLWDVHKLGQLELVVNNLLGILLQKKGGGIYSTPFF